MLLILILLAVSLIVVLCFLGFAMKAVKGETEWQMEEHSRGVGESRYGEKGKRPENRAAGREERKYCWIVLCKNDWFHLRKNMIYRPRIALGATDGVKPLPVPNGPFAVRCDECGKEYLYEASDVLRHEEELPASFQAHPLFREAVGKKTAAGA